MFTVKVEVFWWIVFWLTLIWLTCLLYIHMNAPTFVLPFCFVMCSCLPLCCCHYLAALVVVSCWSVAPVWGSMLGTNLLSLSTHSLLLLPGIWALLVIVDCFGWAEAPVVWSWVYIVGWFGCKDWFWNCFTYGTAQTNLREYCVVGLKSTSLFFLTTTGHRCNCIHCTACMFT